MRARHLFVVCIVLARCAQPLANDNLFDPANPLSLWVNQSQTTDGEQKVIVSGPTAGVEGTAFSLSVSLQGWPADALLTAAVSFSGQSIVNYAGVEFTLPSQAVTFTPSVLTFGFGSRTQSQTVSVTVDDLSLANQNYRITARRAGLSDGTHDVAIADRDVVHLDISAGQGANSGTTPDVVIDSVNRKLLVVTDNDANSGKSALFRCDLDGSGCTYTDISALLGANSGTTPSVVIDSVNNKLLVATKNEANSGKLGLLRCALDGANCAAVDISAGQGQQNRPSAVIDTVNSKLLVATENQDNLNKPSLFRCNLDGTGCTHTDISSGRPANSGFFPRMRLDSANSKILVVTEDGNGGFTGSPALFRCDLDGTNCTYTDLSAGQSATASSMSNSFVVDTANSKLLVIRQSQNHLYRPTLHRCALDGTGCTFALLGPVETNSGSDPCVALHPTSGKFLVATRHTGDGNKAYLFSCSADGSLCSDTDISTGLISGGSNPRVVADTINNRLLVVTRDGSNGNRPALIRLPLNAAF